MKRKLIIHVGMGKTGSSSIQRTLRENSKLLRANGVFYLGLMLEFLPFEEKFSWQKAAGWVDFIKIDNNRAQREIVEALERADEVLPKRLHTLVWSNESLFDRPEGLRDAIEALKSRYNISVSSYVRSPDSWIVSAYAQWGLKHKTYTGPIKSFSEWLGNRDYGVVPKAELWQSFGDEFKIFNFDQINDIGEHFVNCYFPELSAQVEIFRANDTPSPTGLALITYLNSFYNEQVLPSKTLPLIEKAGLIKRPLPLNDYNELLPNENDVKEFVERNRNNISRINEILLDHGEAGFDIGNLKCKDQSVTQNDINRGLIKLIFSLHEDVKSLSKEVARLKNGEK